MATDPSNSSFTAQQHYFITDHLGSTRVVLNNAGTVLERYDYYPSGEIVPVTVANTGNTDYLYTGKESQNALFGINWYDSAARLQTTDGIFTGIDPLTENYYYLSPYAYCKGNPINRLDPDGLADWRMVRKGAGMALMGVGTAIGGGTITAGSAGTASPLGVFLIVEGAGQAGIGLSYMLAGLLVDPEHYSEEEIKNLPGSPSNALAKGVDEAVGNENHEIETTVLVITAAISAPTLLKKRKRLLLL